MSDQIPLSARASAIPPSGECRTDYLAALNPPQQEAVLATEGPLLVLAGAGTGKTKVLTTRIAHLLATGRVRPSGILCVTFTNKAAREMRSRVGALVGEMVEGMRWLGTFHSISAQILRRHAEIVGLKSNFTIIDTDDQIRLLKQVIEAASLDEKRWTGRGLAALVDDWKNRGLSPHEVPGSEAHGFAEGAGIDLYAAYQRRLVELNAADFGDLLLHTLQVFRQHKDVLAEYQRRFRYMLVDEYQDTNTAQYLWLRLLGQSDEAGSARNVCVVGDDDQSIYAWRGAEVENILRFEKDFPGAKVVKLEQNYRSTAPILAAAASMIDNNKGRLGKTLWTELSGGEKIRLRGVWDAEEEARATLDDIEAAQRQGQLLSDIAILVRASFQMRAFEDRLNTAGIPYQVVGGPRFYEREETRDALAYLRLVRNPDDDLSLGRIINKPRRGFGDKALQTLTAAARAMGTSLFVAGESVVATNELKGKSKTALTTLLADIHRWRGMASKASASDLAQKVLDESGYTAFWQQSKSVQKTSKLENLKELVEAASEFDTLEGYLDHVSLVAERSADTAGGQVWLMTLHAAKGLEFPMVFLPGWEEELFPSGRSIDENGIDGLEEERRLAYVGITRARQKLTISFAANRQVYGRWQSAVPSRFVDELPSEHVEIISQPGLHGTRTEDMAAYSRFADLAPAAGGERYDTPGWRRARSHSSRHATVPTIDAPARLVASSAPGESEFELEDRVSHPKFGHGTVERIEGNKLQVLFDDGGVKRVISSFVKPLPSQG